MNLAASPSSSSTTSRADPRLLRTSLSAQATASSRRRPRRQALAELRRREPDVVILDLGCPTCDGLDRAGHHPFDLAGAGHRAVEPRRRAGKVTAFDLGATTT